MSKEKSENQQNSAKVIHIKPKPKRTVVKIDSEKETIEIRGRVYKINKKILRETVAQVWIDKTYHEHLNTMEEILAFLKEKELLIEEFLEHISDSYTIKYITLK